MKKIAVYDRVKSHNGEIPDVHRKMIDDCRKKIEEDGNKIIGNYFDKCGECVPVNERPEFAKMYEMCKNGEIDEVYILAASRISRNISGVARICKQMHDTGTKAVFVNEETTSEEILKSPVIQSINEAFEQEMGM